MRLAAVSEKEICPVRPVLAIDENQVGRKRALSTCDRAERAWSRRSYCIRRAPRWPSGQGNLGRDAEGIEILDYPRLGFLGFTAVRSWFTPRDPARTSARTESEKPNHTD